MRARALRAPVFLGLLTWKTGRCAPSPPLVAASLFLIQPPKIYVKYIELGPPTSRVFSFHWTTEAMKEEVPCPPPRPSQLRWSSRQYFWGHNYVSVRPHFLLFSFFNSFWIFSFYNSLLFLLSFSTSSYSSLLFSYYSSCNYYSSYSYSSLLIF